MDNLNKIISIPTRELAGSYESLRTSNIIHNYKQFNEDCIRGFYYIKKENFTSLNEFYLASHKIALKEYEFNSTSFKYKHIEYSTVEIEEIFHDDMAEDEFHIFHLSTSDELYEMVNYFEPRFKNKFYSIFDKNDKEIIIYQGEFKGKRTNDYILFNRYYVGYITRFL